MYETGALDDVKSEQGGGGTLALFLGLYLLVLAFFIVLVSISSYENVRSKAVMDSLSSTFASFIGPSTDLTPFNALEGDVVAGQRFQEQVTRLYSAAIQVVEIETVQPGRSMRLKLPADALFEPGLTTIRPVQHPLLDRTVAALSGAPSGLRYDMEIALGSETVEDGALPIGETLALKRIGALAREMRARGAPGGTVAVGLKPGRPDEAVIWFFVRPIEDSRLELKTGDAAGKRDAK